MPRRRKDGYLTHGPRRSARIAAMQIRHEQMQVKSPMNVDGVYSWPQDVVMSDLRRNKARVTTGGPTFEGSCWLNYCSQTLCDCPGAFCPCPKPAHPCATYVLNAGRRGKGLFSGEHIPQETFVIEYTGNRIGPKKMYELVKQGCVYILRVGPKEFVDASKPTRINLARYINHSYDPNAVVELWQTPEGKSKALVISKKDIYPNEEITINYGSDCIPSPCLCRKCRSAPGEGWCSGYRHPSFSSARC
ncbi:hypothetical protein B0H14DRAFT_2777010 [Mycena olivaceomarginata]|nr:hypothetical protein B0H14DRAFT_2777010 [Mycena olivaceomarginata]